MINKITGNKAGIAFAAKRKWDNKNRIRASVDKASKLIGYKPNTKFEEGLKETIEWYISTQ
mgnify:CR=1 FL=1